MKKALIPECIVHYSRSQPFRSITSYPPQDWPKVVHSLTESNAWGLSRFSDPNYLQRRTEVESIIRNKFKAKGGQPQLKHPVYCFLGRHERWEEHKLNKGYSINLQDIAVDVITFTYGDSLLAFNNDYRTLSGEKYRNSLCGKVFLLDELESLFTCAEYPTNDPLKIEAQLWALPSEQTILSLAPASPIF